MTDIYRAVVTCNECPFFGEVYLCTNVAYLHVVRAFGQRRGLSHCFGLVVLPFDLAPDHDSLQDHVVVHASRGVRGGHGAASGQGERRSASP